jgi:Cdc6-like AAA superfamily ATPase
MERLLVQCGRTFTPSTPVNQRSFFAGRLKEIRQLIDVVNSTGRHGIIYGDRGVGKTSLASILKDLFTDQPQLRIVKVNCEANDTFQTVWYKALSEINIDRESGTGTGEFTLNQWVNWESYVGPGQIRQVLQKGNESIDELVIVFDEFDRLPRESRLVFADTIKDLSDSVTSATVILVGVANDVSEVITEHASVSRNLTQIKMPPMSAAEIRELINTGLNKLGVTMTTDAASTIVTLSQGYPHFAHLLCKEAATAAVLKRRREVNFPDVTDAVREALNDNSYHIADLYHKATLANRDGTLYQQVLISCALASVDEMGYFSSTDVKTVLNAVAQKHYETYGFSQHLDKFSSQEVRGKVLERRGSRRCYRYRFTNPLLRPYAIIKGMADGLVTVDTLKKLSGSNTGSAAKSSRKPRTMPMPKQQEARLPKSQTKSLFDENDQPGSAG